MEEVNDPKSRHNKTILIIILIVFLFLWYAQLTKISGGPVSFVKTSFSNIRNIFNEDVQVSGNSPLQNILLFNKKVDYSQELLGYSNETTHNYVTLYGNNSFYPVNKSIYDSELNLIFPSGLKPQLLYNINVPFFKTVLEFLARAFLVIGIFLFFIYSRKDKNKSFLNIISLSFLFFLIITVFLPFFSFYYDLPRFYQQFLIVLSLFCPLGLFFILSPLLKNKSYLIISLFLIFYFIISLGLIYQLTGGINAATRLNNVGFEYDSQYIHQGEVNSALWFVKDNNGEPLYIDTYSNLRLLLVQSPTFSNTKLYNIIPEVILKKSYVFSSYTNKIKGFTINKYKVVSLSFIFPTTLLNDNKNKVYNNGESEIFK